MIAGRDASRADRGVTVQMSGNKYLEKTAPALDILSVETVFLLTSVFFLSFLKI
jgi:hypothetical protein